MKILPQSDETAIQTAVDSLNIPGSVLLVPTETVYGLVCRESDLTARDRIYAMKHRAENKPLAIFTPDISSAEALCGIPFLPLARKLAEKFMPGPLTLVVPDAKGGTFGFRIPDHPFILALLKKYGQPLASTSANLSGKPAALSVPEAMESLALEPVVAIDGGALSKDSLASTVVLVTGREYKILRNGPIADSIKTEAEKWLKI